MPKTIQQSVTLPAPAESLYDMYLDPKIHGAFTGSPVTIHSEPGSEFRAFGDMLSGRMLYTVAKRIIVQSWRAKHWNPQDLDSILVLTFWPEGDSGRIELVHVNVADQDFQGVNEGWGKYYWTPWREYLKKREPVSSTFETNCTSMAFSKNRAPLLHPGVLPRMFRQEPASLLIS